MATFPAEQPRQSDDPLFSPWLVRLPILFVSGLILVMLIMTALVGVYEVAFHERILPGVSSYGLNLGGMTRDQASAALDQRFTYAKSAVFTFRDGDKFWQLSAGDLGVTFDATATVDQALAAGHDSNLVSNLIDQMLIWLNGRSIAPIIRYDQNAAVQQLETIAAQINHPPQDATLAVAGTQIQATAGSSGRVLDVTSTLARLDDAILNLNNGGEVKLVINETPPVAWDSQAAAERAQIALSGPIELIADDGSGGTLGPWIASVDQIRALLRIDTVRNDDGTYRYEVNVDPAPFQAYLQTLAPGLIVTPQDARFHFNEQTQQLEVIQHARNGRTLDIPQTLANMEQAIFNNSNRVVPMAFDYTPPKYPDDTTAAELGITQMVSQGTTYYTGSPQARKDNIILAASKFDGVVIAPHTVFSFNDILGDVAPEAGYVQGKVIVGGRTIDGVGGGVCQVSTTAFQAAFYAGYPILERYAHGYQVGYYAQGEGVGMDAAIFEPDLNFRFMNDTDYSLLIETSVYPGNNSVQFRFYSTNPGRQVVKQGPEITNVQPPAPTVYEANPDLQLGQSLQVDWAAQGAEVRVTRLILDSSGNQISKDVFYSNYQPWGAIIQVAPNDPRLNGSSAANINTN
ncbi:MAG TPA: VanW family protein [Phototrophicaceae bacterium]|nr:VanW family protein [Phototrophicaceae bacterium]